MSAKTTVVYSWACQDCDKTGTSFASCEKHSEKAGHTVWWAVIPAIAEHVGSLIIEDAATLAVAESLGAAR